MIAGEYPMGLMMFNHHTVISAQKGAPSDWIKMEPVPVALRRRRHPQGRAASERGAAAGRFPHLGRRPARAAEGRLSAGDAERAGDEDRACGPEDGGFKATFLKPDEVHDRIPGWIKMVGELFR